VDALASGRADGAVILRYVGLVLLVALLAFFLRYAWRQLIFGLARRSRRPCATDCWPIWSCCPFVLPAPVGRGPDGPRHQRPGGGPHGLGMGLVSLVDSVFLGSAAIAFMVYINPYLTWSPCCPCP